MKILSRLFPTAIIASLSLGLAPFAPEPHIVEKFRWIFMTNKVLAPIDWFDLFLHGSPWILLMLSAYSKFLKKSS